MEGLGLGIFGAQNAAIPGRKLKNRGSNRKVRPKRWQTQSAWHASKTGTNSQACFGSWRPQNIPMPCRRRFSTKKGFAATGADFEHFLSQAPWHARSVRRGAGGRLVIFGGPKSCRATQVRERKRKPRLRLSERQGGRLRRESQASACGEGVFVIYKKDKRWNI